MRATADLPAGSYCLHCGWELGAAAPCQTVAYDCNGPSLDNSLPAIGVLCMLRVV